MTGEERKEQNEREERQKTGGERQKKKDGVGERQGKKENVRKMGEERNWKTDRWRKPVGDKEREGYKCITFTDCFLKQLLLILIKFLLLLYIPITLSKVESVLDFSGPWVDPQIYMG